MYGSVRCELLIDTPASLPLAALFQPPTPPDRPGANSAWAFQGRGWGGSHLTEDVGTAALVALGAVFLDVAVAVGVLVAVVEPME